MLPISMMGGIVFYKWMHLLAFLSPYLICLMLTITYFRLELREFMMGKYHMSLILTQLALSAIFFFTLIRLWGF